MIDFPLKVYYGWAKLNKISKREALTVIFINDLVPTRIGKDGYDGVTRFIDVCSSRFQTSDEIKDASLCNRLYTVYSIFMDDPKINFSLETALHFNFLADSKNVSLSKRKDIMEHLRTSYIASHPLYKEPTRQLYLDF